MRSTQREKVQFLIQTKENIRIKSNGIKRKVQAMGNQQDKKGKIKREKLKRKN
jgi:hypothetical protein